MHPRQPFTIPVLDPSPQTTSEAEPRDSSLLPATCRTGNDDLAVPSASLEFLEKELLVDRLNKIYSWLRLVGRPMPPRALHHQQFLFREIVITEQMDLHLLWSNRRIFLKPIPRFLLSPDFWTRHLLCSQPAGGQPDCNHDQDSCRRRRTLAGCALGFLFSYAALISHESDYRIAREKSLLPEEVSWTEWKILVEQLLAKHNYKLINQRFIYGELRLSRINTIYRLTQTGHFVRGYAMRYTQYSDFFQDNLTNIASVLAYIAIVLTAMQVGLATTKLAGSSTFQNVSWGFTVFSIIAPPGLFLGLILAFAVAFVYNWADADRYRRQRLDHMGFPAKQRKSYSSDLESKT